MLSLNKVFTYLLAEKSLLYLVIQILVFEKIFLLQSEILSFGIRNATNDLNREFNFHWQRLEISTCHPESTEWNPEPKTVWN